MGFITWTTPLSAITECLLEIRVGLSCPLIPSVRRCAPPHRGDALHDRTRYGSVQFYYKDPTLSFTAGRTSVSATYLRLLGVYRHSVSGGKQRFLTK